MPKVQNNFSRGTVNQDANLRFIEPNTLVDAENAMVINSENAGGNGGLLKNVTGNVLKTAYGITGAVTIGQGSDEASNKVYNFIKGTNHDYIIEYDTVADTSAIVLQSTTGTRLNFQTGERILNVEVIPSAEGNGSLLKWSGDSNPPRIGNVERMKTWGIDGFTAEEIMLIKAPPLYPPTLVAATSTENDESNNLEDRFLSFAYRYKYKDGYYSCISTWSPYFFVPGAFDLDFESFENLGMQNIRNAVDITFNTGSREVIGVDLVYKLSNSTTPYIIEKFIKEDESWADNTEQTFQFNNSKVYSILPESEYFRSFDNVPLSAVAQAQIGSRSAFANYVEGRDLIDKNDDRVVMDYSLELVANNITSTEFVTSGIPVEYSFEGAPTEYTDAALLIEIPTDTEFREGASIYIDFNIKSTVQEIEFIDTFSYQLEADYTDLSDLLLNSGMVAALEVGFQAYFEANGGITLPDDAIEANTVILQVFEVEYVSTFLFAVKLPVIKYEIDVEPDPNTFIYDYFQEINSAASYRNIAISTSLKSRRSYEICMIYRDAQGRKTTALTSGTNTLFIPNSNSVTQNQIQVNIPLTQLPPAWATTYKFGIKVNKGAYEQIMASIFFIDGAYRWIKLDGENKNKVKEGDTLIVKKDSSGALSEVVKVKVLEIKQQDKDFIEDNVDDNDISISEPAGLYMKIKPTNFEIDYDADEFLNYSDADISPSSGGFAFADLGGLWVDNGLGLEERPLVQGSVITLDFKHFSGAVAYYATKVVNNNYGSFEEWFQAELPAPVMESGNLTTTLSPTNYGGDDQDFKCWFVTKGDGNRYLRVRGLFGLSSARTTITCELNIRSVDGYFVFETEPIDVDDEIFYETPEVYDITDGEHEMEEHILTDTFNCFTFGNGVESYQIRDAFNEKSLSIDFCPTAISEDEYREIHRYADITYSGVFNENTNVNKLNEFNLSLGNFKDDIEKAYGAIMKIKGQDTNLQVYQENKVSQVFYGKDLLFNADGTTNLSRIEDVLGQQKTYEGEYGISSHPDSYDGYGYNDYFCDVRRGVVLKKSNNGIFEISSQGMRNYFKKLFRNNTINHINGKYDQFQDMYILNIQYNGSSYVTWMYSDKFNGWLGRQTFNPEDMLRINNDFISFKNGEVYQHNQTSVYNTFYGVQSPSTFTFVFSQEPSVRKNFKNLEIEGTDKWAAVLTTDLDSGYVNLSEFEKKEGVYYAYNRFSNAVLDTGLLSTQGIGNVNTIVGNTLNFAFNLDSIYSIGDQIRNASSQVVGTIVSKTATSLTLDAVANIVDGDYVMCCKPQSIENNGLLGYYMQVQLSLTKNSATEIFAVNSEIAKSNP